MKDKKCPKVLHTDNEFLMAIKIRSVNPWLPVAEVAEEINEDERRTRDRLLKMSEDDPAQNKKAILEKKVHGNVLYFRLKK